MRQKEKFYIGKIFLFCCCIYFSVILHEIADKHFIHYAKANEFIDKEPAISLNTAIFSKLKNIPTTIFPASIDDKTVYLTFDDGPSKYTEELLAILKEFNAKATFFMLEPNMRKYSESLKSIVKNGHKPALHGISHRVEIIYKNEKTVVDEMVQSNATLKEITGIETKLVRTPFGSSPFMNESYHKVMADAGFHLWDWTVDSEDWRYRQGQYVNFVIKQMNTLSFKHKPMVVLFHEKKSTIKHLRPLLEYLQKEGYKMEALDDNFLPIQFNIK